jgi:hypothetical protein
VAAVPSGLSLTPLRIKKKSGKPVTQSPYLERDLQYEKEKYRLGIVELSLAAIENHRKSKNISHKSRSS